ncbi:hypothetical protein RFN28_09580 [Mesorhizobium sp. VK24D]|uniref:Uncharacterized protein n=1 Tax=Mesorhizobium album TaxID=3072314 RepID=A0ABU4XWD3_9HYPH|nr:hypothetical protein [Mesorhizobium sp. VK24D]MDX8478731.1 hypothetical protein [Mesorhizobium sp. VK24D]
MKSAWELKGRDNHRASVISGSTVLLLHAFIYSFFLQANSEFATLFSRSFQLTADLGKCSTSFSAIVMSQMVYSIVFAALLTSVAGKCLFEAIADKENRKSFLWIAGGAMLLGGYLIGLATTDHGWWLTNLGRRSFNRGTTFPEACSNSPRVLYPQPYFISFWLAGLSWLAFAVILAGMRRLKFRIQYDDLPLNPQLREEILKIRAKYPPIPTPKQANSWLAVIGLLLIVGGCTVGLCHGFYKAGMALSLLVLGPSWSG